MLQFFVDAIIQFSHQSELAQLSEILVIVILITGVLKVFKQPIIIGYLIAGIFIGPFGIGLATTGGSHSFIELFSHLGIALLLFMVGLGLNPKVIKEHGKTAVGVGLVQIIGTFILGFILAKLLDFDAVTSAFIAAGLTFSSTIVIVKLLSDLDESESLYGKIAIGVLIVQDIVVMILLMLVSVISTDGGTTGKEMLLGGVVLLVVIGVFAHVILPRVMRRLVEVQEYILLVGIGWCLLLGSLFHYLGFSFEIGCLLAGMSFAMSPYRIEIANRLKSLRDFFLVLFFLHVGMQLSFTNFADYILPIIAFSVFVMIGKPVLIYTTSRLYGFTNKTALKAGMSLGQISEFSFLLIGMGIVSGHIADEGALSLIMFVGLMTIIGSTYMTIHNGTIYKWRKKKFGEGMVEHPKHKYPKESFDVVLFGYGKMGARIAETLDKNEINYLVVDHNPNLIRPMAMKEVPYIFADATNIELYNEYINKKTKMVISTIRDYDDDREIIKATKANTKKASVLVVSSDINEALSLYDQGADYVIMPEHISAHHAGLLIEEVGFDLEKLLKKKLKHVVEIQQEAKKGIWQLLA